MVPQYIQILELADILCVSWRTAARKVAHMKKELGLKRWQKIETEQAIEYFRINRYKIDVYFEKTRVMN